MKLRLILFFVCILFLYSPAQNFKLMDSARKWIPLKSDTDTVKTSLMAALGFEYSYLNLDSGLVIVKQAMDLGRKQNFKRGLVSTLNMMGTIYQDKADYKMALECYTEARELCEELNFRSMLCVVYSNEGNTHIALKDFESARHYELEALKIGKELKMPIQIYSAYMFLGNLYLEWNKIDSALYYFDLTLTYDINDKSTIAFLIESKARCYRMQKKYDLAEKEFSKAIQIAKELKSDYYYYGFLTDLAEMYVEQGRYKQAEPILLECVKFNKEGTLISSLLMTYTGLYKVYEAKKDYHKALYYHEEYSKLNDSINNAETNKIARELERKYEDEKKKAQIAKLDTEKKQSETENERKGQLLVFAVIGCALVLIALGFAMFAFVNKRKANIELQNLHQEVSAQKNELFDKNKNITDSILYAQRIQKALLTSHSYIKESVEHFFIINKPKDIVSGDFYWAQRSGKDLYFMLADCTGHGVPGAFMSLLGISFLNELVVGKGIKETHQILNELRAEIILALTDKDDKDYEMKDGMDAVLCRFDFSKLHLEYSAANNAMAIVRNGKLIDLKGDKMPVGRSPKDTMAFTKHEFALQKNDMVYLFSDGFPDQFGGPKGKKLKERNLKAFLVQISSLSPAEQEKKLLSYFADWKGDLEQVDDVCLAGFRV